MNNAVLSYHDAVLFRSGERYRILAGAIHYFRVHPDHWQDRLRKLKAMGANTVDTYVAWNFHQPSPDIAPDFSGWRDLGRFIDLAAEEGLDVIVRPGPYICAEWDNGGFPAWLTGTPGIGLRCLDPLFTDPIEQWFDHLLPIIASRQASVGGPVVAVQIENEYGSYGDDHHYIRWNRRALEERGITEMLFTADGGTDYYLDGGAIDGTWATATLGSRGDEAVATWARRRPGEPFFNVEFWGGWFDHWGEHHHVRDAAEAAAEVRKMLDLDGSVCIYMAHGGTNFGLRSGSNHNGSRIQPTVTSYDSDAPIAENGALTPKFHALRREFLRAQGIEELTELPQELLAEPAVLPAQTLPLAPGPELLALARAAGAPVPNVRPLSFEQLGLDAGMVLYSADAVLPGKPGTPTESALRITGLNDRAYIWVDGAFVGILDDVTAAEGLKVTGKGAPVKLEILVENLGRINYGPLTGHGKGILGGVLVNQRYTFNWTQTPVRLAEWGPAEIKQLAGAEFVAEQAADSYLALPDSGKGFVWINGFLLGRYWGIGPQQTLYVPAPLIRAGSNIIKVLELEKTGTVVELRESADLGATDNSEIAAALLPA
ncbi:glycoside hydrolase family 35 protein [Arthrobacter sp. MMS18-M83]|uniref:glycoside hydrolase family 35 protein n=1 Tax=Arthrobacter sp. MMS18-M83 TaxID=2996261 RepID=UPI00227BDE3B|nr:beta-galactosidase family protein [Arthrobacter sp. MMS18-M83]WAH96380.1 beta-galactosidase [Arthrobacter sp. MMS18-M83]